jgi:signal transduction histidine kinase
MATLIDELLDITQSESSNGLVLLRSPVDLRDIAQRVIDEYRSLASNHELTFVQHSDALIGHWDAARLERVVGNLISNAIKYSPNGGEIVISLGEDRSDGQVVATLSVSDSGLGIRANELDRVFHRFERGSNVADIPGNGIGLAYAKDIAAQHGGTITVSSELGHGSSFTLRLPLTSV